MNPPVPPLPGKAASSAPFRIGDWLVQPALNRVLGEGGEQQVEPRLMHVLVCLASRPGEVISRTDLLETVWNGAIVQEEALTHAISQLRRLFGDDPRSPRVIETIHKTGYRLIAPVSPPEPPDGITRGAELAEAPALLPKARGPGRKLRLITVPIGIILVIAIVALWQRFGAPRNPPPPDLLHGVPFTSYPGREIHPALSPDGARVAFAWNQRTAGNYDLFVKQRNTESPLRLTDSPLNEYLPTWSPDGTTLAYAGESAEGSAVYSIPAIGGTPRRLFAVPCPYGIFGLDWSPAGDLLVVSATWEQEAPRRLDVFSLATHEMRNLLEPPADYVGDFSPAFSPDGTAIAFVRADRANHQDVYIVPLSGGRPRRLTSSQHQVEGITWMPDGEHLIFAAGPDYTGDFGLWFVSLASSKLTWLPTRARRVQRPSLCRDGSCLAYEDRQFSCGIYQLAVPGEAATEADLAPLLDSTANDFGARYSPTGDRISFISTRSGSPEVWICERDGSEPRQLTYFQGANVENARWSYDQTRVAFTASPGERSAIFLAEVESGALRQLTSPEYHGDFLNWSRDGEWLYLRSDDTGEWRTVRLPVAGGEPVPVFTFDVYSIWEAEDGDSVYYCKAGASGLWRANADGSGEQRVFDSEDAVYPCYWHVTRDGVFYFRRVGRTVHLAFFEFATQQATAVASFPLFGGFTLDVAPDGTSLLMDRVERIESDLVLVDGLR
jgi:Tol biopolymer transport system component/DNA-binding winged helix-turn-helix (wHTH) protein